MSKQHGLVLIVVALVFQGYYACDSHPEEQLQVSEHEPDYYLNYVRELVPDTLPYSERLYYQNVPGIFLIYDNSYRQLEGRNRPNKHQTTVNPFEKYFIRKIANSDQRKSQAESRFILGSLLNAALFNNRFRPVNAFRPSLSRTSIRPSLLESCITPNGDAGVCTSGSVCAMFGGRPSGSCILGKVCCINEINSCGGTITLNNTYWQSPPTEILGSTICALNIKLDSKFLEQIAKPICQIRLDFVSFTIAQPIAGTCTDTFQVGGTSTAPPIICGDNSGQHMYLDVPSTDLTSSDIQLTFNFARTGTASSRLWNIKIALLPCGAPYLAPVDCLQYFTSPSGRVSSFNWKDVPVTAVRQLNNQNYNACFRTELIDRKKATEICFSVCATTNAGAGFSVTTNAALAGNSLLGLGNNVQGYCTYDFLGIRSATDSITGLAGDRFCGEHLNTARAPLGASTSIQLCTPIKPFKVIYVTDGTEAAVGAPALVATPADTNNVGFCIDYQERAN
ncbi:uncharacterized protein LOC130689572 isoform X1 [Daphnia carinata]|uniref:uncharacterized protein LOC130689572 isoform X1 n=1 Tax=Daphnia carinata TaxID=120202 RepID=UPI0028694D74|nr:uncharacterized protein LOC130689572 isoform X1 [Daphnia carinata]